LRLLGAATNVSAIPLILEMRRRIQNKDRQLQDFVSSVSGSGRPCGKLCGVRRPCRTSINARQGHRSPPKRKSAKPEKYLTVFKKSVLSLFEIHKLELQDSGFQSRLLSLIKSRRISM